MSRLSQSVSLPGSALARLRRLDREFVQLLAEVHVLVQPQLERRTHKAGDQAHGIARVQAFLDLALELRVQHLGAEHIAGACEHVFRHELDALGQQRVELDEALHRLEQTVAQTAFVRAARGGGDQVDVAFADRRAFFGEAHAPRCALALGKALVGCIGKPFAFEQRNHRIGVQRLRQIVAQAALVLPVLRVFGFFVDQRDRHAGHQHRLAAQQVGEFAHRQG